MDDIKRGTRVLAARTARKITQEALARALDVSVTTVSRWENGHNDLSMPNLEAAARVLDVSVVWLAFGRGKMGRGAAA